MYTVTINQQRDLPRTDGPPQRVDIRVFEQSFEDADFCMGDVVRMLNAPKRKPRVDRGQKREKEKP